MVVRGELVRRYPDLMAVAVRAHDVNAQGKPNAMPGHDVPMCALGTFILACGTTHLMEIWNIWHASYLLAGVIKAITAAVSVITAAMLIPLVPKVISLPGRMHLEKENRTLEQEIAAHKRAEEAVRQSSDFRPDPQLVRRLTVFAAGAVSPLCN